MSPGRFAFGTLLAVGLALAVACGSDDAGRTGEDSTATSSASPADVTPGPPTPQFSPGVTRLSEGTFTATLQAGGLSAFEPIKLPLELGAETPACDSFVFTFGWRVLQPDPVAENGVIWQITRDGAPEEIGRGGSGNATVGCGFVEARNNSGELMTLKVHYLIGRSGQ